MPDVPTVRQIPVAHVSGEILGKLVDYINKHEEEGLTPDELAAWDLEFLNVDPPAMLLEMATVRCSLPDMQNIAAECFLACG
jgi:hypothetical protein